MPISLAFGAETQRSMSKAPVDAIHCCHEVFTSRICFAVIEKVVSYW